MTDESSKHRMASGKAMMYLTGLVKCDSSNRLPANPSAKDRELKMSSLGWC